MYTLVIGNKNYSSWSLRPWLLMKHNDIGFKEVRIPLFQKGYKEAILAYSPSGKVPCLLTQGNVIWDSLAICEYLAEQFPDKGCWPEDDEARGLARAISHEMHSGFFEIRNNLPMNCRRNRPIGEISQHLQEEIDRVCDIWKFCLQQNGGGEFLFGRFSIADAMYAPVVLRFKSYAITLGHIEEAYMKTMLSLDPVQQWIDAAFSETESIPQYDEVS